MYNLQDMLNRIKEEKKKKGYTTDDLSAASGIPKSTLSKILAGIIKETPVSSLIKIAGALDVSTEYLIYGIVKEETHETPEDKADITMLKRLDTVDRAEIRGTIKQMLKAEKYQEPSKRDLSKMTQAELKDYLYSQNTAYVAAQGQGPKTVKPKATNERLMEIYESFKKGF